VRAADLPRITQAISQMAPTRLPASASATPGTQLRRARPHAGNIHARRGSALTGSREPRSIVLVDAIPALTARRQPVPSLALACAVDKEERTNMTLARHVSLRCTLHAARCTLNTRDHSFSRWSSP
jgi:hypothetical protein